MEYCSGGDLFSYLERRNFKIPEPRVATIIHKLATGIYYLHSYGIIHRDLKPENILMLDESDDSELRIVDFGLSKILSPHETCNEPFGTLCYVAPEVLLELPYNKPIDIWSLGIITYLLLTGCLPFDDQNSDKEIARKTIYEPVPFPALFWKHLSFDSRDFVFSKYILILRLAS
jgi:serine/threonine protein kinase